MTIHIILPFFILNVNANEITHAYEHVILLYTLMSFIPSSRDL